MGPCVLKPGPSWPNSNPASSLVLHHPASDDVTTFVGWGGVVKSSGSMNELSEKWRENGKTKRKRYIYLIMFFIVISTSILRNIGSQSSQFSNSYVQLHNLSNVSLLIESAWINIFFGTWIRFQVWGMRIFFPMTYEKFCCLQIHNALLGLIGDQRLKDNMCTSTLVRYTKFV